MLYSKNNGNQKLDFSKMILKKLWKKLMKFFKIRKMKRKILLLKIIIKS